jgi:hypothetical protein
VEVEDPPVVVGAADDAGDGLGEGDDDPDPIRIHFSP